MTIKDQKENIKKVFGKKRIVRSKELIDAGVHQQVINSMVKAGELPRLARGLYKLPETELSGYHSLAEVASQVDAAVISLLSALQFHGIGTQMPFEVWIAIPRNNARPSIKNPPLRINIFSGKAYTEGIEIHRIEGIDVALEALKDCIRKRCATIDNIIYYASICRVKNVIKPYLKSIV
jgi:predicted transcriptional regulator of viral defense system